MWMKNRVDLDNLLLVSLQKPTDLDHHCFRKKILKLKKKTTYRVCLLGRIVIEMKK